MGLLGPFGIERPILQGGRIVGWSAHWKSRRFPLDMAAFAFDATLLRAIPGPIWTYTARGGETEFLERLIGSADQLEILCDGCRRCYVWHDLPLGRSPGLALAAYRLGRCATLVVERIVRPLLGGRRRRRSPRPAMKPAAELKILETSASCLLKRNLPDRTTLIFTGEDWSEADGLECRVFGPGLFPWLMRSLARGEWDIVFCHAPVRPLWDRKHGFLAALGGLLRRLVYTRSLGTYALRGRQASPLVMLDFNDEPTIPAHAFHLLIAPSSASSASFQPIQPRPFSIPRRAFARTAT